MKNRFTKQMVAVVFGLIFLPQAMARYTVLSESLTDKLRCQKVAGERVCNVETMGRYTIIAKITGDVFTERGIFLDQLNENTPMDITVGDFAFSTSLGNADSHKLAARRISAKWTESADKCVNADCSRTRRVRHTMLTVNGGLNGVTIRIVGSSLVNDNDNYGQRALADMCDEAGNGQTLNIPATLTINGIDIVATISGTCNIQTRSVTRNSETFQLQRTIMKARETDNLAQ